MFRALVFETFVNSSTRDILHSLFGTCGHLEAFILTIRYAQKETNQGEKNASRGRNLTTGPSHYENGFYAIAFVASSVAWCSPRQFTCPGLPVMENFQRHVRKSMRGATARSPTKEEGRQLCCFSNLAPPVQAAQMFLCLSFRPYLRPFSSHALRCRGMRRCCSTRSTIEEQQDCSTEHGQHEHRPLDLLENGAYSVIRRHVW